MKQKLGVVRIVALCALAALFLYSGYQLMNYYRQQQKADDLYTSVQQAVTPAPTAPSSADSGQVPVTVDFGRLLATCEDVVGWLHIPHTPINYPVVQGEDNDVYLHRLLNGDDNTAGSLFVDYRNTDVEDSNYIIYGHSMKNGTMFGTLAHYKKQAFFDVHPVGYYLTPEATYVLHFYAGFTTDAGAEAYTLTHTGDSLQTYMTAAKAQSDFVSDVTFAPGDTVLTLSTCAYDYKDARYVLLAIPEKVG